MKPEGSPPTVILTACLVGQSLPEGTIGCRFWLPLTSPGVVTSWRTVTTTSRYGLGKQAGWGWLRFAAKPRAGELR